MENFSVKKKMKIQEAVHRAEAAELQSRAIQAENDRKTKELEEARQLQLSMLPKDLPNLPHLDIAVYMNTATEVGGDYYDFIQLSNNWEIEREEKRQKKKFCRPTKRQSLH